MLGEPENQFSLTRAALSTGGRKKQIPNSLRAFEPGWDWWCVAVGLDRAGVRAGPRDGVKRPVDQHCPAASQSVRCPNHQRAGVLQAAMGCAVGGGAGRASDICLPDGPQMAGSGDLPGVVRGPRRKSLGGVRLKRSLPKLNSASAKPCAAYRVGGGGVSLRRPPTPPDVRFRIQGGRASAATCLVPD